MNVESNDELIRKIRMLSKERNATILVHNYQVGEVQQIADRIGDSLELSRWSSETKSDVIVFCGVRFMAETAKILSPDKTVLLPAEDAGCPMARMINPQQLKDMKSQNPDAVVVCYVNSTAEIKAMSDLCCTSANASRVVKSIEPGKEIIFIPDQHLGAYTAKDTGRHLVPGTGYCHVHTAILADDVKKAKDAHPGAPVLVHPECPSDVIELADAALSTAGMVRFAGESDADTIIIGTEVDMTTRLKHDFPQKSFIPVTDRAVCPNMKKTTLPKVLWALENMQYRVELPDRVLTGARGALERMLAASAPVVAAVKEQENQA